MVLETNLIISALVSPLSLHILKRRDDGPNSRVLKVCAVYLGPVVVYSFQIFNILFYSHSLENGHHYLLKEAVQKCGK